MTLLTPSYMQPASGDPEITYSALQDRAGLIDALISREGVLDVDAGQLLVTPRAAGANYSVDIAAGRAAIRGDDASDQGTYVCINTTPKNLATPARPASGTRRHRLVARVRDKLHNGTWSVYDWTLQILADTGSGTPAQPASAVTLAFITMTSTMTSVQAANIEDGRARASVGTPARVGDVGYASGWGPIAGQPSPTYQITPDGWVLLAGMVRRVGSTFTATAGINYQCAFVPAEIRTTHNRNLIGATRQGPAMLLIAPDGLLYFNYQAAQTVTVDGTWVSLDGCAYRLDT